MKKQHCMVAQVNKSFSFRKWFITIFEVYDPVAEVVPPHPEISRARISTDVPKLSRHDEPAIGLE